MRSLFFLMLLVCWSCQPAAQEPQVKEAPVATFSPAVLKGNESAKNLKKKMVELRKVINPGQGTALPRTEVVNFVQLSKSLANAFPKDIEAPKYLSTSAEFCRGINEVNEALALYGQVFQTYPNHSLAPPALFFQGFILENELNQKEKARVNYELFLEKYPDHEFANSVKLTLEQFDKTPEELIRSFQQKNK